VMDAAKTGTEQGHCSATVLVPSSTSRDPRWPRGAAATASEGTEGATLLGEGSSRHVQRRHLRNEIVCSRTE
jgi:hypothetical protein